MNRKQRRAQAAQHRKAPQRSVSLAEALEFAIKLHQQEQYDEAEKIYRQILSVNPEHPDALHFSAVLAHQRGRSEEAIELIRRVIDINPHYADAHNNLGNVLKETGRFEEAAKAYRACLAVSPDNANALCNLGAVLRESGEYEEALASLMRSIELAPKHYQPYHNLGNVYKKLGRYVEAVEAYRKSISLLHPDQSKEVIGSIYKNLTRTLFIDQKHNEAIGVLKQWLSFDPSNPVARHMLAACSGEEIPERASDAYVAETFDVFAGSFDEVLKRLDYRAPELVGRAIREQISDTSRQLSVLDAGCGTGLCGPILRDYARRLTGVDLSKKMIEKARGRNDYDELVVSELTGFMQEHVSSYDLIACADTLCYFGKLEDALAAAEAALTQEGLLAFSVEKLLDAETEEAYRLNPHGRYSHTEKYVVETIRQSGMQLVSLTTEVLRMEGGAPVTGMIITARKI